MNPQQRAKMEELAEKKIPLPRSPDSIKELSYIWFVEGFTAAIEMQKGAEVGEFDEKECFEWMRDWHKQFGTLPWPPTAARLWHEKSAAKIEQLQQEKSAIEARKNTELLELTAKLAASQAQVRVLKSALNKLSLKCNKVTAPFRHSQTIDKDDLWEMYTAQCEAESVLAQTEEAKHGKS